MKFVRFFSNLSLVQLGITNLLLCFLLIYSACRKDTMGHPESATDQTLMQAVERSFESGQLGDLALGASPVFSKSMERSEGGTTFLLTPIEGIQAGNMGANLAFYKDLKGNIQHLLVLWRTADAGYTSEWAPFKGDVAFSGDVAWVNAQNVVLSSITLEKGQVQYILPVHQSIPALVTSAWPDNTVQDRGPGLPNLTSLADIEKWLRALPHAINGTGSGGSGSSGGGGYVSNTSDPYYQYVQFRTTCSLIKGWVVAAEQSIDTHPYERVDYRLCELIDSLMPHYTSGGIDIGYCLWKNYLGSGFLESIFELWEQSDKSGETAAQLVAALNSSLPCP